jgi:hypothetical protein
MAVDIKAALRRLREGSVVVREVAVEGQTETRKLKVTFSRPPESDFSKLLVNTPDGPRWVVTLDHVKRYVNGWEGWTEADLLGSAVGASDPVPFDPELWSVVAEDSTELVSKVGQAILDAVVAYLEKKQAISGN